MDKTPYRLSTLSDFVRIRFSKQHNDLIKILKKDCVDSQSALNKFVSILKYIKDNNFDLSSFDELVNFHELLAVHDGAITAMMTTHFNLAIGTIKNLGPNTDYINQLYQKLISYEAIGVYLATELAHGNDLTALETQATYFPEKGIFILNSPDKSSFKFMPSTTPCQLPKIAIVLAKLNVSGKKYGIFPFVLPLSKDGIATPGVTVTLLGDKAGFHLDNAMTSFDCVEIPFEGLLAGDMLTLSKDGHVILHVPELRDRYNLVTNNIYTGKLCMAVWSVAAAKSALYIVSSYGRKRKVSSHPGSMPIIDFPHFKEGMAWDTICTIAHSIYLHKLTERVSSETSPTNKNIKFPDEILVDLILAKALCTWRTQEILLNCRERCGAQGVFTANKIPAYIVTNFATITAEGDNIVLSLHAGDIIINKKLDLLTKNIAHQEMISILQNNISLLRKKLISIFSGSTRKRRQAINDNAETVLILTQTYAALKVVITLLENNDNEINLIAEGYLFDWIHRNSLSILKNNVVDRKKILQLEEKRVEFIRQHSKKILDFISAFNVSESGIETPISSDNYINWYGEYHKSHGTR